MATLDSDDLTAIAALLLSGGVRLADAVAHGGTPGSSTATFAMSRLVAASQTADTPAFDLAGNGSGAGLRSTGGSGGSGIAAHAGAGGVAGLECHVVNGFGGLYAYADDGGDGLAAFGSAAGLGIDAQGGTGGLSAVASGANAPGMEIVGAGGRASLAIGSSSGDGAEGIRVRAGNAGSGAAGIRVEGKDTGAGLDVAGGDSGHAVHLTGGGTAGSALYAEAQADGEPGVFLSAQGAPALSLEAAGPLSGSGALQVQVTGDGTAILASVTGIGNVVEFDAGSDGVGLKVVAGGNTGNVGVSIVAGQGDAVSIESDAGAGVTINAYIDGIDIVSTTGVAVSAPAGISTVYTAATLATFFLTDTTKTYADAVAGSVVKEIADNAGGADPLAVAVPGPYASGTVGYRIGTNLDATVSSRSDFDATADHVAVVTLVDTLTTYTGNTVQTGDAYGRIGAAGAGLTAVGLAATGLDAIAVTDPGAPASMTTLPKMLVGLWRYFYKKSTMTATQLKTYADDGTTVRATGTVSDDATTQTKGAMS